MNKEKVSILATAVNFILAVIKLAAGLVTKSAALIADGIHSGLDIASSFVTYLGTKIAKKPADKKHPYGHGRSETIASFIVTFLLLISAVWIIYEGVISIFQKEEISFGIWAIIVIVVSIIVNEVMARIKFKVGRKEDNLALIADAEHSRADSISSIAVLVGLILTYWFVWADGAAAILVGLYIIYQTFILSKQVIDNLIDISNPELEKQIKKICQEQEVELVDLKTRKIGSQNFAELKIGLDRTWKMNKVEQVIKKLEELLIRKIGNLQFVTVSVVSHNVKQQYLKSQLGQVKCYKGSAKLALKKLGKRVVIPIKNGQLYSTFGAPEYLVIDRDEKENILQKKIIKNPYFTIGRSHGMRFIRELEPDIILTQEIGEHASQALKEMGVEIIKIDEDNKEIKRFL